MTSLPLVSAKAKSRGSGLFDRSIVITAMELNESVAKKQQHRSKIGQSRTN